MISMDKEYRTRDGQKVRIYATDGGGDYPVHGAIIKSYGWTPERWSEAGFVNVGGNVETQLDLIEVKPRIKREHWVNVYPEANNVNATCFISKAQADNCASPWRIACVKITIDCEEGEGL